MSLCMSKVVRVPDPVYEQLTQDSESMDVSMGAVLTLWMEAYHE